MSEVEMKRAALLGGLGSIIMVSTLYAANLFLATWPIVVAFLGLGFWLFHSSKRSNAIRMEMHARTKAAGLRSYPAPNWVYGANLVALIVLVATPLFGRLVFDRLGLEPVATLVVSWVAFLLLMGEALFLLMKEISLVYAYVASLDAGEAAN